jgi:hypothetical protein
VLCADRGHDRGVASQDGSPDYCVPPQQREDVVRQRLANGLGCPAGGTNNDQEARPATEMEQDLIELRVSKCVMLVLVSLPGRVGAGRVKAALKDVLPWSI